MDNPYKRAVVIEYPEGDASLEKVDDIIYKTDRDVVHTVMDGETLQNIANRYYGDSGKWYIIANVNNIYNALEAPLPGTEIIIPYGGQ